jgi:hypothetical protein
MDQRAEPVSNTPAAQLARLKVTFPAWTIRPVESGTGYTAHNGATGEQVHAATVASLEYRLAVERRAAASR